MKLVEETVAAEPVDYDCTDQQISQNVSIDYIRIVIPGWHCVPLFGKITVVVFPNTF